MMSVRFLNFAMIKAACLFCTLTVAFPMRHSEAAVVIRVTEFMSEGQGLIGSGSGAGRMREFFELTNLGDQTANTTNWSYNDNNTNDPVSFGLTISSIAPSESVIFTQLTAAEFRNYWNLPSSIQVFSIGNLSNLGNADTINIYNSSIQDATTLVETFSFTSTPDASFRGSGVSRNRPLDAVGLGDNANWFLSAVGDQFRSVLAPNATIPPVGAPDTYVVPAGTPVSTFTDLGNPGQFVLAVPEPSNVIAIVIFCLIMFAYRHPSNRVRMQSNTQIFSQNFK